MRHGILTRETEGKGEFDEIVGRLHRGLGFPGPWDGSALPLRKEEVKKAELN